MRASEIPGGWVIGKSSAAMRWLRGFFDSLWRPNMTTTPQATKTANGFLRSGMFAVLRQGPQSRRAIAAVSIPAAAAVVAIVAGANWSWLVTTGIVSVLLSVLPCVLMCGLGLCMHKFSGGTDHKTAGSAADLNRTSSAGLTTGNWSCCSETRQPGTGLAPANDASNQLKEKNDA